MAQSSWIQFVCTPTMITYAAAAANEASSGQGIQPRVDRVLEDAPQKMAKVPGHFGRPSLDRLQRCRQFEPRDRGDRPATEHRHQVLVDFAPRWLTVPACSPALVAASQSAYSASKLPLVAVHACKP